MVSLTSGENTYWKKTRLKNIESKTTLKTSKIWNTAKAQNTSTSQDTFKTQNTSMTQNTLLSSNHNSVTQFYMSQTCLVLSKTNRWRNTQKVVVSDRQNIPEDDYKAFDERAVKKKNVSSEILSTRCVTVKKYLHQSVTFPKRKCKSWGNLSEYIVLLTSITLQR